MNDADKLRKLAGIDKNAESPITGVIGTDKGEYQRKHNIRPGTDEWFKLWFSRPSLTGEKPIDK
jgi:hypothetical protein